ncbi:hypothetical protein JW766_03045 [Candidatus Dojkabacteria bacterium]|nr:hypothetical protein [Candidatus Dojkabacteria bacterium]
MAVDSPEADTLGAQAEALWRSYAMTAIAVEFKAGERRYGVIVETTKGRGLDEKRSINIGIVELAQDAKLPDTTARPILGWINIMKNLGKPFELGKQLAAIPGPWNERSITVVAALNNVTLLGKADLVSLVKAIMTALGRDDVDAAMLNVALGQIRGEIGKVGVEPALALRKALPGQR